MAEETQVTQNTQATQTTQEQDAYLTPEEQLSALSDKIISSIIRGDDTSKENRRFLFGQVSKNVFNA